MQMFKRTLSIVLTVVMLVSMFSMVTFASAAWDGTVATEFESGSGTEANPYIIVNAEQLALMSTNIAAGTDAGAYYKLGADITLNEGVLDADYNLNSGTFTSWTSGGTFSGVFDGDGHTIYGFYSTQQNGGLFSTVKGTIKNLKMKDAAYKLTWTVFGILASKVSGATIENVEVDGAIIGNQTGNDQQSRGIMVGRGSADFIGCIVRGKVVSTNVATVQRCGGFIGVADSTTNFTNCVNYADLGDLSQVGGFAGLSTGAINFTDCINYGNITSSTAYASYLGNSAEGHSSAAGGFVGVVYKGHPNFTRCANEGTIIGDSYAGGLIGVALNYYHTITLNNIYNIGA
ncbi:MAG: hypothetical protein IIV63_06290, partial [Clostridia bacterium]|nr:hypothetical protein [Clostridia bacterium]